MLPVVARADTVTILGSGQCGDSAYWKVTSDGVMTIYGSGALYDGSNQRSLFSYYLSDVQLVIEEGITSIGKYAFKDNWWIQSVSFPSSLKVIDNYAFFGCYGLAAFDFPGSLIRIGSYAFSNCNDPEFSSLVLPDSVLSVESFAFSGCSFIESCSIGSGLQLLGSSAFKNCSSLVTVNISPSSPPSGYEDMFLGCPDSIRIYVPNANVYESAFGWSAYADWIVGGYTSGGGNTGGSGSGGTVTGPDYTFHLEVEHTHLDDYYLDTDLQFWTVWSAYAGNDTQIDRSVIWSVDGLSNETYIDSDGLLHIGEHESRQYLNIRATSVSYPHLYAYAVIELTHMSEEEANTPTTAPTEDNSEVLGAIDDLDQDVQQLQDSVDTLIEGDDNSAAASDELGSASQVVSDAMDQVDDFQQSQMDVLDDNMQQIQDSVDFSGFVPALEFIMEQVNSIFDGIGDVSVILTFPLYLGLFFYICSRAPGGTIPKISRFKSIDGKAGGEKV